MRRARTRAGRKAGTAGRWALVATAALVVAVGCRPAPPPPPPNVILILADTLRADRLGAFGGTRGVSPFLDDFARGATVFAHAYAQAPWTEPSVASLFTSRFMSQHGMYAFGSQLDPGELTLAELLHARGYATGAFIANFGICEQFGYAQGFDAFETFLPERDAAHPLVKARGEVVGTAALRWVDQVRKDGAAPIFLYLHYMEAHLPYTVPDEFVARVARGRSPPAVDTATGEMFFSGKWPPQAEQRRNIETVYDAEVLSLDEMLRHTFAALRARHLLDNAVVVFVADHGEELGDHGHWGHGSSLYEELIHVPLVIAAPGQSAGVAVREPVALIDVAPTVADLAGAELPASFEGRSLRRALPGPRVPWWRRITAPAVPPLERQPVFSELIFADRKAVPTPHERAIIVGGDKLIVGVGGERERYDVTRDPAEEVRLDADENGPLHTLLAGFADRLGDARAHPAPTVPPDLRERLKALGYLN